MILVGYDDMEPLSGITLKLRAFSAMLKLFPEYRTSAVLVQVPLPLQGYLAHKKHPPP